MSRLPRWAVYTVSFLLFGVLMEARHQAPNVLLRMLLAGAAAVVLAPALRRKHESSRGTTSNS